MLEVERAFDVQTTVQLMDHIELFLVSITRDILTRSVDDVAKLAAAVKIDNHVDALYQSIDQPFYRYVFDMTDT